MTIEYKNLIPILMLLIILIWIGFQKYNKRCKELINKYWFYTFSKKNILSKFLYLTGISILLITLADFRGEIEKSSAKVPKQKTIILIDISLSMLAEDVRPNRLEKSVILARHLVKNLIGHSISVILFSDTHKKLVPFTSDTDLIDSKLNGLSELRINNGGTNLSTVIMESLIYLKDGDNTFGNIVVLTDAEENEIPVELKIPDSVSIAMVAIGTKEGAKIPIRGASGMYIGSQRFKGSEVITKIGEETIKQFGKKIKNFQYWIASSYSLPTEDIAQFLNNTHKSKFTDGEVVSKPVIGNHFVALAILILGISFLLSFGKAFVRFTVIFAICLTFNTWAQDDEKEEEKSLTKYGEELKEKYQQGEALKIDRLRLAQEFLISKFPEIADKIYNSENDKEQLGVAEYSNWSIAKFSMKSIDDGLVLTRRIIDSLNSQQNDELLKIKDIVRANNLLALKNEQQQQQKQKQEQKKDNKNKKDGSSGGSGDKEEDKKDEKDKNKNEKQENKKDDNKQDDQQDKDSEQDSDKKNEEKKKEIPALLKQLVNDDKKLQGKRLDTKTSKDERRDGVKKNW